MVQYLIKWILLLGCLLAFGFLALFSGYGLSRDYNVLSGLTNFFELNPAPVENNPTLQNVHLQQISWLADINNRALDESSGLTASQRFEDVLFSINDSGSDPLVYGLDLEGAHRGTWRVDIEAAVDWEAMDAFQQGGESYLLIADTGDNLRWRNDIRLLVVHEPMSLNTEDQTLNVAWQISLRYPDGAHDVEAVSVDAEAGWVYLLSKRKRPNKLYRVPLKPSSDSVAELVSELTGMPYPDEQDFITLEEEAKYRHMPTGMDLAGNNLVVVTLKDAYLFDIRQPHKSPRRIRLPTAGQREAVSFAAGYDSRLYVTRERYEGRGDADLYQIDFVSTPDPQP